MSQKSFEIAERKRNQTRFHSVMCQVVDDGEYYILDPDPDASGPVYRIQKRFVDVDPSIPSDSLRYRHCQRQIPDLAQVVEL